MKVCVALLATCLCLMACSNSSSKNDANKNENQISIDTFKECHNSGFFSQLGIVGGSKVDSYDPIAKRVVLLLIESSEGLADCTGTPITNQIILTAAHCVKDTTRIVAKFSTDLTCESGYNSSKSIEVIASRVNDKYNGSSKALNDIALIKLAQPIPSDYIVSSIYTDGQIDNDDLILAGYGVTNEDAHDSLFLRKVTKSIRTDILGRDDTKQRLYIDQSDSQGVCSGDSGGPNFIMSNGEYKVLSINSVGMSDLGTMSSVCHGKSITMYLPYFKDWITQNVQSLQ